MSKTKKHLVVAALVLVAVAASSLVFWSAQKNDSDPLAELFLENNSSPLESNFVKSGMVKFSGTWPSDTLDCAANLSDTAFKEKKVSVEFDYDAAAEYMKNHTTKDVVAALSPVFGKAIGENSINWTWSKSEKKYSFIAFPGDEKNWACYFQTVGFFKDVFKNVTLDYSILGNVDDLSATFADLDDPIYEVISGKVIDLEWGNVAHADSYTVYYGESPEKMNSAVASSGSSARISNLDNDTIYYLGVKAKNSAGEYSPSADFDKILKIDTGTETICDADDDDCGYIAAWDVDLNGENDADTDGKLIANYLFSGAVNIDELVDTVNGKRTSAAEIEKYLNELKNDGFLDVDGNGTNDALTDGLLLGRYMSGYRGESLIEGAIAENATRTTPAEIIAFIKCPSCFADKKLVCTDSDGGNNIYEKGTVTSTDTTSGTVGSNTDYCRKDKIDLDPEDTWYNYLTEFTCDSAGGVNPNDDIICENGCEDGACKIADDEIVGELTTTLDDTTPASSIVVAGNTGVEFARFKIAAKNEGISIHKLQILNSENDSNITSLELFVGDTLVGKSVLANGVATFGDLNLVTEKDKAGVITLKADLKTVASGAISGGKIKLGLSGIGFEAIGIESGEKITDPGFSDALWGNEMTIYATKPTVGKAAGLSSTLVNGQNTLFGATISADAAGEIFLQKLTFEIEKGGNFSLDNFKFFRDATDITDEITFDEEGENIISVNVISDSGHSIPAGASATFYFKADASEAATNDFISTKIVDGENFIWSDDGGQNWRDGDLLETFGEIQTLTK